jgi:hypothetical protein
MPPQQSSWGGGLPPPLEPSLLYIPSHDTSDSVTLKPGRHRHKNPSRVSLQVVEAIEQLLASVVEHSSKPVLSKRKN